MNIAINFKTYSGSHKITSCAHKFELFFAQIVPIPSKNKEIANTHFLVVFDVPPHAKLVFVYHKFGKFFLSIIFTPKAVDNTIQHCFLNILTLFPGTNSSSNPLLIHFRLYQPHCSHTTFRQIVKRTRLKYRLTTAAATKEKI